MKYPKISKQPRRQVNIPQLSGGLNLRDSLSGIRDNQMTDCVNMWYKEGMLITRPPLVTSPERLRTHKKRSDTEKINTKFHNEIKVFYSGCNCVVASNKIIRTDLGNKTFCDIEFEFQAEEKVFVMPMIRNIEADDITYFCTEMGGLIYCYVSDFSVWTLEYVKITEENVNKTLWNRVTIGERYVPTVYIHCQRSGWADFEGTFFEGYNLISDRYKMIYSAYNDRDSDVLHPMRYALGNPLPESGEVNVELTSYDVSSEKVITVNHKISYTKDQYDAFTKGTILIEKFADNTVPDDGLYLFIKYNYVGFLYENQFANENGIANIDSDEKKRKYACSEDNIVITAPYTASESDLKKIFCMTRNTWFGGASTGINGGSRLFLCGNTQETEKSLILWSGLNNPLYFSENCFTYVGSKSRAVTAFGKQGENLIVFKENKIYATYYRQNTDIDAESLTNQIVIDYEANSVYFPMILINGYMGCDCPDTIQMCRNRLVWATSEGKVYTLCRMSQYNEHTVYELSDMIMPKLKEYKDRLKTAASVDFDGHYILFLEDCAFVMNYCCYGYQYVYSYSKSDDANALIPWYFWDFSFLKNNDIRYTYPCITMLDSKLLMRIVFNNLNSNKVAFVGFTMNEIGYSNVDSLIYLDASEDSYEIKDNVINCSVTTKLFELGLGIYTASVDNVVIKIGSNDAEDIIVKFITEQGEETVIMSDYRKYEGVKSTNFIKGKKLNPSMRNIAKFGLKLKCNGRLCIDGLSLQYRLLGGVK